MKHLNVKTFFGNDTEGYLLVLSESMMVKCAGNPNFVFKVTTPGHTSLMDCTVAVGNWHGAVIDASTGDPEKIARAVEMRGIMEPLLSGVAQEVNTEAKHDKAKLISSGGELTSEGGAIGIFAKPVVKDISAGPASGTLASTLVTESKALGTMVRLTNLTTKITKEFFTTQKHIIIVSDLTIGVEYEQSFAFVGTNATLNYSDPIGRYPQK